MATLNIRPVTNGGSKLLIALCGTSGSGKTYTALQIAMGMTGNPAKIGFLDTENKRGSLYADILPKPFLIGDLIAPFSPIRYVESIKEFVEAGVEVLIVDSVSHEWEGEGGCEDIADKALENGKKMADWKKAKREHKKFINALLQAPIHLILCVRAREKTSFADPNKPVSLGIQPICEKNFMFEMTASLMMGDEGKEQKHIKVPSFLKTAFSSDGGYLGIETGKRLMQYVSTTKKDSPELAKFKGDMMAVCEQGLEALKSAWKDGIKTLTAPDKATANSQFNVYEASAKAFDEGKVQEPETNPEATRSEAMKATVLKMIEGCKSEDDCNQLLQDAEQYGLQKELAEKRNLITGKLM